MSNETKRKLDRTLGPTGLEGGRSRISEFASLHGSRVVRSGKRAHSREPANKNRELDGKRQEGQRQNENKCENENPEKNERYLCRFGMNFQSTITKSVELRREPR